MCLGEEKGDEESMCVLIISDIHGNRSAFQEVLGQAERRHKITSCILLGDLIDYGMHSNEVIKMARTLPYKVLCSLRGNHEEAVIRGEYSRFSSDRGRRSARHTKSVLTSDSWDYISREMEQGGKKEFELNGKKCLAVHGSLEDEYWKSIRPESGLLEYDKYDYVFSGHSHLPHMFESYYECEDVNRRNKKKVIFINPGSVGQPRNLDNRAQYAVLNMERGEIAFEKAEYDIETEQAAFCGQVDDFYCERLRWGI